MTSAWKARDSERFLSALERCARAFERIADHLSGPNQRRSAWYEAEDRALRREAERGEEA